MYDVFLSFSSLDEHIVKPVWQELSLSGLRVFWSDSNLKSELGKSWYDSIETSLEKSKNMILICSKNSMSSDWVRREYRAFMMIIENSKERRLIPLLTSKFQYNELPLFLKELQAKPLNDDTLKEIINILGGTDVEKLKKENAVLNEKVRSQEKMIQNLKNRLNETKRHPPEPSSSSNIIVVTDSIPDESDPIGISSKESKKNDFHKFIPGQKVSFTQIFSKKNEIGEITAAGINHKEDLLIVNAKKEIRMYSFPELEYIRSFYGHQFPVKNIKFIENDIFFTASKDKIVKWNISKPAPVNVIDKIAIHHNKFLSITNNGSKYLEYTGSYGGLENSKIKIFKSNDSSTITELSNLTDYPSGGDFHPNEKVFVIGYSHGNIKIYSSDMEEIQKEYMLESGSIKLICFSPDGNRILSFAESSDHLKIWSYQSHELIQTQKLDDTSRLYYFTFNSMGNHLLTISYSTINFWNLE